MRLTIFAAAILALPGTVLADHTDGTPPVETQPLQPLGGTQGAPPTHNPDGTPMFPRPPVPAVVPDAAPSPSPWIDAPPAITKAPIDTSLAYGDRGMREAGGSAGFMVAPQFHSITVAPSFGYFIADNVQLSTIVSLTSIRAGDDDSTIITGTLEPSYHLKLDHRTFLLAGMGFGYSWIQELGSGLTYTMRIGGQFLVKNSGVFAPTISYDFRTNEIEMPTVAKIATERALRINLGYTMLF